MAPGCFSVGKLGPLGKSNPLDRHLKEDRLEFPHCVAQAFLELPFTTGADAKSLLTSLESAAVRSGAGAS